MTAALRSVATALPEHRLEVSAALGRLRDFWPQLDRLEDVESALGTRYTCEPLEDLVKHRGLGALRSAYIRHAGALAESAARRALEGAGIEGRDVDLVISVSCTGYVVPSLDVHLASTLGLRPDVTRLPITELGCSGGAAAIGAAHRHLAGFPDDRVLVVAVELPSLSFQPGDQSIDNLTACLVFGDGAGAAVVARPDERRSELRVERAGSHLIAGTADILGFDLRDSGFHVVLDRRLPRVLKRELPAAVERFVAGGDRHDVDFYAVHAAGPRIFTALESSLGLPGDALALSRQVFYEVGNTSSAAIFFVLKKLVDGAGPRASRGLGIGIGPGVTVELLQLAWTPAAVHAAMGAGAIKESGG